jgi:copper chaperone CopZ
MGGFILKKSFRLVGLDCANCASKMETAIKKLDGVTSATVNFMTTKMTIEGDDGRFADIVREAESIIRKVEPEVVVKRA